MRGRNVCFVRNEQKYLRIMFIISLLSGALVISSLNKYCQFVTCKISIVLQYVDIREL